MKIHRYKNFIKQYEINEGIVGEFYDKVKIKYLCKKFHIENYTINKDGSIDVDGDVNLQGLDMMQFGIGKISKLPLKFGKVGGNFNCRSNKLESLEGAPTSVGGHFYCYNNKLTSLEGSPLEVGGDFYCSENELTSLSGAPREVGGNFSCEHNKLTSLEGSPLEVGGHFDCRNNQLTSLEGSPRSVGHFYCKNNQLTSLEGSPHSVGGDFICSDNQLESLSGISKYISFGIYCQNNKLRDVKGIKDGWRGDFWIDGNPVHEIFKLFQEVDNDGNLIWDEVIEYLNEYEVIRDGKIVILQALELVFHEMGLEVPEIDEIVGYQIQY